jgi:chromosome segregation ATPase
MLINKLHKELTDIKKDNIAKANELHQENIKLHSELEKIKEINNEQQQQQHNAIITDTQNVTLQTMFKSIQHTFNQFEESLNKFDKETQSMLKMKHIEQSSNEIKNKIRNWIDEVKTFNESQLKTLSEVNEKKLKDLNDKLDEMKWNVDKKDYTIKEQCNLTDTYKRKLEVVNKELEDTKEIANSKNELIDKQKETITMLEERVSGLEKENADLEVNLNKNVFNYKMKEDEIETLVMVFGGILSKRKDKYEHNMKRLSVEPKRAIEELVKQYKLFK